ncbi:MAG: ABC transporter ATP-binding protein [Planctomycetes bacterium]|nr:ABC transporter ATP-binding protein [Planctomycetota bacterium]
MSTPAIVAEDLGKQYKLGLRAQAATTFREALALMATAPLRRWRALGEASQGDEILWALRNVSFEVQPGEVIGIIGRNGAGKSTLLKVLARITDPSEGRARIRGRVRSLLEVGTGMHPELTGRDNIYLNGALLGMKKAEIERKFDEIVAFAEIERFLDTPVKRYSSGMSVRLGFAVAAHLEPEILLVDEVLAVGDLGFQKKCVGKMEHVAGGGRTVLFVSHNMAAVRQLCSRAILLEQGTVALNDTAHNCIEQYRRYFRDVQQTPLADRTDRSGSGRMKFVDVGVRDAETGHEGVVASGNTALVSFRVRLAAGVCWRPDTVLRMSLLDEQAYCLSHCSNLISGEQIDATGDEVAVSCRIRRLPLNRGFYTFSASVGTAHEIYDYLADLGSFEVTPGMFYQTGRLPAADHSSVLMDYTWTEQAAESLSA